MTVGGGNVACGGWLAAVVGVREASQARRGEWRACHCLDTLHWRLLPGWLAGCVLGTGEEVEGSGPCAQVAASAAAGSRVVAAAGCVLFGGGGAIGGAGTGESGKSTLFKQIQSSFGSGECTC